MCSERDIALVERLATYDHVVEVGIGTRSDVAAALAESDTVVTAVDVHEQSVPENVGFVRDDVTSPVSDVYADSDAIYGLRLPPELHRPVLDLAERHDLAFLFTTLGGDPPTVPAEPEPLPGTTLYRSRRRGANHCPSD